jgi:hypothetical protein
VIFLFVAIGELLITFSSIISGVISPISGSRINSNKAD